jgi:hypothetical protein
VKIVAVTPVIVSIEHKWKLIESISCMQFGETAHELIRA